MIDFMNVAVLLGCIAIGVAVVGLNYVVSVQKRRRWEALEADGTEVFGRVVERRLVRVSSKASRMGYDVAYRDAEGNERQLQGVVVERTLEVGNQISLRYHPATPQAAVLAPSLTRISTRDLVIVTLLFTVIGTGLAMGS